MFKHIDPFIFFVDSSFVVIVKWGHTMKPVYNDHPMG